MYGVYLGNNCTLNAGCFHGTQIQGLGLSNGAKLTCWGELSYISSLRFIAFPKSITYTYNYNSNRYIPLVNELDGPLSGFEYHNAFGNPVDNSHFSGYQWGNSIERGVWSAIKTISLNPFFLRLYLPYAKSFTRLVIPERMSTFGLLSNIGVSLKTLVLGTWDMNSQLRYVYLRDLNYGTDNRYCLATHLRLADKTAIDNSLSVYVPKYIYAAYANGVYKSHWRSGVEHISEMLSDDYYQSANWVLPFVKEAPCFTDYRQ